MQHFKNSKFSRCLWWVAAAGKEIPLPILSPTRHVSHNTASPIHDLLWSNETFETKKNPDLAASRFFAPLSFQLKSFVLFFPYFLVFLFFSFIVTGTCRFRDRNFSAIHWRYGKDADVYLQGPQPVQSVTDILIVFINTTGCVFCPNTGAEDKKRTFRMLYSVHKKERGFYVTRGIGPQVCFFFFCYLKSRQGVNRWSPRPRKRSLFFLEEGE